MTSVPGRTADTAADAEAYELDRRVELCRGQIAESPYSHTVAAGWYAQDVPDLLAALSSLQARLAELERERDEARGKLEDMHTWGSQFKAEAYDLRAVVVRQRQALQEIAAHVGPKGVSTGHVVLAMRNIAIDALAGGVQTKDGDA